MLVWMWKSFLQNAERDFEAKNWTQSVPDFYSRKRWQRCSCEAYSAPDVLAHSPPPPSNAEFVLLTEFTHPIHYLLTSKRMKRTEKKISFRTVKNRDVLVPPNEDVLRNRGRKEQHSWFHLWQFSLFTCWFRSASAGLVHYLQLLKAGFVLQPLSCEKQYFQPPWFASAGLTVPSIIPLLLRQVVAPIITPLHRRVEAPYSPSASKGWGIDCSSSASAGCRAVFLLCFGELRHRIPLLLSWVETPLLQRVEAPYCFYCSIAFQRTRTLAWAWKPLVLTSESSATEMKIFFSKLCAFLR